MAAFLLPPLRSSLGEHSSSGLIVNQWLNQFCLVFPDQEYYNKGDYIIREGEEGNTFYIIANGKVICNTLSSVGNGRGCRVKSLRLH